MSSTKRKALEAGSQRRVRARRESTEELEEPETLGSGSSVNEEDKDQEGESDSQEDSENEEEVCFLSYPTWVHY